MNCIIVDDEYPAREELKYFIKEFSNIDISKEFDDSLEALQYIEKNKPNIVFLDISMPKLDGIALGKILSNFKEEIIIVFITAHKEYAVSAFEIEAFDYLLKPYSEERILSTLRRLEKIENHSKCINNKITLKYKNKFKVINICDICYCKAHERETVIHTDKEKFIEQCSISEFYKRLPSENFFKSHRSYVINIEKIVEIIPWFNNTYIVKLQDVKTDIPVSRNNIQKFKHLMGI